MVKQVVRDVFFCNKHKTTPFCRDGDEYQVVKKDVKEQMRWGYDRKDNN